MKCYLLKISDTSSKAPAVNLKYIIVKVYCEWLKKTEAETGIFSHGVSLNMVRDLFVGRGGYLKYTINNHSNV
jgi:hypothetical protein